MVKSRGACDALRSPAGRQVICRTLSIMQANGGSRTVIRSQDEIARAFFAKAEELFSEPPRIEGPAARWV